ncbi:MAG: ribonuclease R, partial [Oscillospiraceae bacterium]|nr:ribonuclease R [Oscillospiraceae bacterium]
MADISQICISRILNVLEQAGKKAVTDKALYGKVKGRRVTINDYKKAISWLRESGDIMETKNGFVLCKAHGLFKADVARINKTFGFIRREDGVEIFVPGKVLLGSMPGDTVICRLIPARGESPEAEVVAIAKEGFSEFSGTIEKESERLYVRPDSFCRDLIQISENNTEAREGDKVLAVISKRGQRHADHRCKVCAVFGSSDRAYSSALAVLYMNDIETEFPVAVQDEARHISGMKITDKDIYSRLDLRDEIIFTIDGADTKDIDDAISVEKTENGWKLGVHIADVSHYVKPNSELDKDAFLRGTSIYYANKVIPMLPKELSKGICSLNPNEDRLAFSCLMEISEEGKLEKYKFSKTVICSRVKGVYSEVNKILEFADAPENIPQELSEKYDGLIPSIFLMQELAEILTANKLKRGAPQIDTPECKLTINENEVCTDVQRRERGKAELIIEEFMLMANESAAKTAREHEIPFVFRVHENPAPEKISELIEVTDRLNIPHPHFSSVKPVHLAEILNSVKDSDLSPVINNMVLRSMAKAKYADEPLGHFGLVLKDYAHFTSPIRRYPDLAIHRILTELCYDKTPPAIVAKKYGKFANAASLQSSDCEITAMRVERECEDCYIAEYMTSHLGEEFEGMICGITDYGMYVELPNTVEGLVKMETLPDGVYEFDGHFSVTQNG